MHNPDLPNGLDPENGRAQSPDGLRQALAHWRAMIDAINDPIFLHDDQFRIVRANAAYAARAGMAIDELAGRPYWEVFPAAQGPLTTCTRALADQREHRERVTTAAGEVFLSRAFPVPDADGETLFSVHILEDIHEEARQEEELSQLNRALRVISDGNRTMLRASSEQELLDGVCRTGVDRGGFRLAWVGVAEDDPDRTVRPVAWAGPASDYLEGLHVTWADNPEGQGPTGRAIREGRPVAVQNITGDPRYEPWRETALKHGFQASLALPLSVGDGVWGALNLYATEPFAFSDQEVELLSELANDLAYGIQFQRTQQAYEEQAQRVERALEGTVRALAKVAEYSDPYTAGHQARVSQLARAIAEEMGWEPEAAWGVEMGGWIHDIGKTAIPTGILNKSGGLSPQEFELIKTHCDLGREMVADTDFPWPVTAMVHQHHERLDGSGYPQGLRGDRIAREARILAVADVVEAMCAHRPYRPALGPEQALAEIENRKGTAFDAEVVDACLRLFREKGFAFDFGTEFD